MKRPDGGTKATILAVCLHAIAAAITLSSCQALLLAVGRLTEHDMDFHRHVDFRLLWVLFPICSACGQHPFVALAVFSALLVGDLLLCRRLARVESRCPLLVVSLLVSAVCLLSLVAVTSAVSPYIGDWVQKLDRRREHLRMHSTDAGGPSAAVLSVEKSGQP